MHRQMSSSVSCKYLSLSLKSPPNEVVWDITSLWQESNPNHFNGQKCFRKILPTRLCWHSPCCEASKLKRPWFQGGVWLQGASLKPQFIMCFFLLGKFVVAHDQSIPFDKISLIYCELMKTFLLNGVQYGADL